jgi:NADH dehydrogenase FAD-containing subunit
MSPNPARNAKIPALNKHVVFVGAGHAHIHPLSRCAEYVNAGARFTVIAPGHFWASEMGPGLLSGLYPATEDVVDIRAMVTRAGGRFIQDEVTLIDPHQRSLSLSRHPAISYDILSLDIGSEVPLRLIPGAEEYGIPVKPASALLKLRETLTNRGAWPHRVVVLGGGAAGCEVAANIRAVARDAEIVLVTSDERLLAEENDRTGRIMHRVLEKEAGVQIITEQIADRVTENTVVLESGQEIVYDSLVVATGVRPSLLMRHSRLRTDEEGALDVNPCLQSTVFPEIFGAGDCIHFAPERLERDVIHAIREGRVLHHNIFAYLTHRKLRRYHPLHFYPLFFNLGDGTGLLSWYGLAVRARWVFWFKDLIDRSFVGRYAELGRQ